MMFQIKMSEIILFQKLSEQEQVILKALKYLERLRDDIMVDTIINYSQTVNNENTLCIIIGKDHVTNIMSLLEQNGYNQIFKIEISNNGKNKYYNKYNKYKNKYLRLKNNYKL